MAGRTVTVTLGGRERALKYDLNAIAEIGERLGIEVRLSHLKEDLFDRPLPLGAIRTLVWAGLRHEEPDLEETTVGAWIDHENIARVMQAFFGLFESISSASLDLPGAEEALARMQATDAPSDSRTPAASPSDDAASTPTPSGA